MHLGQIELPVTFGVPDNFRIEKLTFDVADFETAYNVILGRPMLGKFMVVVRYAYQVLKISGPKGIIIVKGDQCAMVKCDKQSLEMVEHFYQITTTSRDIESKHLRIQATGKSKDSAKDSKFVSLADTFKSDDSTKDETNDSVKYRKADSGTKGIAHRLV
ncbi:uncharacterized protein LOC133927605 [Phragmites australis]|uniref:uncharacterized protein LOC133927605 n=1 Tax=Phragmites australis TaxID=29695 RepID=UPI002D77C34D|nr:uncharacterized protein LOC133927605 [Phragmites australis]